MEDTPLLEHRQALFIGIHRTTNTKQINITISTYSHTHSPYALHFTPHLLLLQAPLSESGGGGGSGSRGQILSHY